MCPSSNSSWTTSTPPPLPADPKPAVRREPALAPAPAAGRAPPVSFRREAPVYRPGDEDQYDIPAFLRRGAAKPTQE